MKKDIHPQSYRTVVFKDFSCDESGWAVLVLLAAIALIGKMALNIR